MRHVIAILGMFVLLSSLVVLSGCLTPQDAIAVSNDTLDFGLNERPQIMDVWNSNASINSLTILIAPLQSWIKVDAASVTSAAPAGGALDVKTVRVSIDRSNLSVGSHEGSIVFTGRGAKTKTVKVLVTQNEIPNRKPLNIENPVVTYSEPYLIEFSFTLTDKDGNAVSAEPNQFQIAASESGETVDSETGVHLRRAAARQLKAELVLDYTESMQEVSGAIDAMENAAKNVLLPALNEDALVGITEFHADHLAPARVSDFTVDRAYLRDRIDAIQSEFVHGYYSASRAWDALGSATQLFASGLSSTEDRYIILFSDGNDTSSVNFTRNHVVDEAVSRGIHIYAIGFGANINETDLLDITTRTGGKLFPAASTAQIESTFTKIVADLGGQYYLRWASTRRNSVAVDPSFTISYKTGADTYTATYTAEEPFVPSLHAVNPAQVLQGRLLLVTSDNKEHTTVFLRADYVPRFIRSFSIFMRSQNQFTVSIVEAAQDGLLAGWHALEPINQNGGTWYEYESPGDPIPFATFGPMLRIDFDTLVDAATPLFDEITVDNSLYANGQSFIVEGYALD